MMTDLDYNQEFQRLKNREKRRQWAKDKRWAEGTTRDKKLGPEAEKPEQKRIGEYE